MAAGEASGRGSSVPLSDQSVFIPASPSSLAVAGRIATVTTSPTASTATQTHQHQQHQRTPLSLSLSYEAPEVVDASLPPSSPASTGARSTPSVRMTSRRSRAHQPRLLGLDRNEEEANGIGASEDVLLTGLGIHAIGQKRPSMQAFSGSSDGGAGPPNRPRSSIAPSLPATPANDEDHSRIADESEDEVESVRTQKHNTRTANGHASSEEDQYVNDGSYSTHANPFQRASYDNDALLFGDSNANVDDEEGGSGYKDDDDDDDDDLEAQHAAYTLLFESITQREQTWMWTSVAFVVALSLVSIAIAADWIDWPGDGIGKN